MPSTPRALQHWPRGSWNQLHKASHEGSTERIVALLSGGSIDINEGGPNGWTPLMCAVDESTARVVKLLLSNGANVSIVADHGATALHRACRRGHLIITHLLIKAGAPLEVAGDGFTPLLVASFEGHSDVMSALIKAGVNPNTCNSRTGETPLYVAALKGHVKAVRVLLRAGADALLTKPHMGAMQPVPLDGAAQDGHVEVVRELLEHLGIEGCGGASGGVDALRANIGFGRCSARVVRLFADAGVDMLSVIRVLDPIGGVAFHDETLLSLATSNLCEKKVGGKDATEEQLNGLKGIRRLLLRVEVVHAVSWLWCTNTGFAAGVADPARKNRLLCPLVSSTLPTLRRRAAKAGVILGPVFR